jgi:hypothetical protein
MTPRVLRDERAILFCCLTIGLALGCAGSPTGRTRSDAGSIDAGVGSIDAGVVPPDSEACASSLFAAESSRRPIDIVIWLDDGGSFDGYRGRVASAIQESLVDILVAGAVDYKILLMSSDARITISDTTRFVRVGGGFSGGGGGYVFFADPRYIEAYRDDLRDGAFRVFLSGTDCENEAGYDFAEFERRLDANGGGAFIVGDTRNFAYHMLGNLRLKTAPDTPLTPYAAREDLAPRGPLGYTACNRTQEGARATGGLRLGIAATDYDELFRGIADASIVEARLPCTFDPPDASDVDLRYVRFRYRPGGDETMEEEYHEVADEAACTDSGGFYPTDTQLVLCPSTCERVSADPAAEVLFTFECVPF